MEKPKSLVNKNFILCWFMQFFFMFSFNITVALIAKYVVHLGESATVAGIIAGMFSIVALLCRPFIGYIADNYSKKPLMAVGFLLTAASFFGYALFPNVIIIAILRITHAVGMCIQTTVISVVAMNFIPEDRVVDGTGRIGMAVVAGMALGPTVGVFLLNTFGFGISFLGSGVAVLLSLFALFSVPIPKAEKKPGKFSLKIDNLIYRPVICFTLMILCFSFCGGLVNSFIVMLGDARGITNASLFFLLVAIGSITVQPLIGRWVDKKGLQVFAPIMFAAEICTEALLAFASSLWMVLVAGACRAFGYGAGQPTVQGEMLRGVPADKRGIANASFYMGVDVGQGTGGMVGGALIDITGYTGAMLSGSFMAALGIIPYLWWLRQKKAADQQK